MKARPARYAIFLRVSTAKPEQEHGLVAQRRACEEYMRRRGWPLKGAKVYTEQASGRQTNRPVLRAMLHDAAMHVFQVLVLFRLDRLSRGGIHEMFRILKALDDHGVRVYSVGESWFDADSPARELVLAVLAWAAEFESKAIGERVAAGIAARRAEAGRKGRPFVWGRAHTSFVARDPVLPRKAVEMRTGDLSWSQVARRLGVSRTTARRLYAMGKAEAAGDRRSREERRVPSHREQRAPGRRGLAQSSSVGAKR